MKKKLTNSKNKKKEKNELAYRLADPDNSDWTWKRTPKTLDTEKISKAMSYLNGIDKSIFAKGMKPELVSARRKEIKNLVKTFDLSVNECTEAINKFLGQKRFSAMTIRFIYNSQDNVLKLR